MKGAVARPARRVRACALAALVFGALHFAAKAGFARTVEVLLEAGADVILAGMRVPPNYGAEYADEFAAAFPAVAETLDVPLIPFLLEGVAGIPELNLEDGIHPNAAGQGKLADNVLPVLREVLEELGAANFDPELHRQYEPALVAAWNRRHPEAPVRLRRRRGRGGLRALLRRGVAS